MPSGEKKERKGIHKYDSCGVGLNRAMTEGAGIVLCLETENVDAAITKSVSAGAVVVGEIEEGDGAGCGGRGGKVKDPYGIIWLICSPAKKCSELDA